MKLLELLVGRTMKVMTDMKVEIELEIHEVKENHHSRDLWPATENWTTYTVKFTNGASKNFNSLGEIDVI